jgi:hypothetical protein
MTITNARWEAPSKCEATTPRNHQVRLVITPSRHRRRAPKPRRELLRHLPRQRCVTQQTRQATFLAAYHKTASIAVAAKAAGIQPAQHYRWLAASAAYCEAFRELQQDVIGGLQDKVMELAMDGWAELVLYRGRVCGTIRHHSDRLLIFFLEAAKPEKWRQLRSQGTVGLELVRVPNRAKKASTSCSVR